MSLVIPVILCGGSGTRLWPLSRSDRPKQLISLGGDHTLLEGTLLRAKAIAGVGDPICVTAAAYGAEVRQSLDRLGLGGMLLLEPEPRNTAPALCAAALVAMCTDPKAIIVALPADHVIENSGAFACAIAQAVAAAERGWLTILGVRPRHASPSLGYIVPAAAIDGLPGVRRVNRFVEKPEVEIARSLIAAGALWNAGIVVARAEAVIAALEKHEPAVLEAAGRSLANGRNGTDEVQLNQADFSAAPRISFDKAALERHRAVAVTALDAMWRDVGTWAEVGELYPADRDGNRNTGMVHLTSSRDTFVYSPHRLTVGIGLTDVVVVDTPDALLIVNRDDLGKLQGVVEGMNSATYPGVSVNDRYGHAEFVGDEAMRALRISLSPGETTRREPHEDFSRHWMVLQGSVEVTIGNQVREFEANQSFHGAPGTSPTLANVGTSPVELIEVHLLARVWRRPLAAHMERQI